MTISTSQWLDLFFESYFRNRPVNATFIGVHDYDSLLPDFSEHGIASLIDETQSLLDQIDSGAVEQPATKWESIDRLLARNYLRTQLWELGDSRILLGNPCLYTGEAVFGIISLFLRDFQPIAERSLSAVSRLQAIPSFLEQGTVNLTSCPEAWVDKAVDECDGAVKLLTDGIEILAAKLDGNLPELRVEAANAADSFLEFRQHLVDNVFPASHDSYGVGKQEFDELLKLGHCLDTDSQVVTTYALRRLEDAKIAMLDAAKAVDSDADPEELFSRLREIHPTTDEYYDSFQVQWDLAKSFAIDRNLLSWPDYPISFEPIPDWARSAAPHLYFLFYRAPAPFDPHVNQRYLVTPIKPELPVDDQQRLLETVNLSQIRLNHVIHHGGIGHHVQNWWAYRGKSRIGQMAAVDCSQRIAMLCGGTMAEGWACYATDLMNECGYLTPLENLAEQQGLARMAGRAIVDAGLHSGEMSFDEAVNFYTEDIGMPEAASRAEAVKNSMFPGAAMMYLVGTDMIHSLREDLRQREGSDSNLCRFHDDFLSHGSIPVALTAKLMKRDPITDDGYIVPISE